jgi:hypothetical protein
MSITATSYVLNHRFGSSTRKLIMIGIADFANDSGEAWPSIDTLAQRAECSRRTVQESIRQLEKDGDLQIRPNAGQNGCHRYRIIFRKTEPIYTPKNPSETDRAKSAPPQSFEQVQNSDAQTAKGGADHRPSSAPEPSRTVREPSRERGKTTLSLDAEAFAEAMHGITTARDQWSIPFTADERAMFQSRAEALCTITPAEWQSIRRYLHARHPQGSGAYTPMSRERFIRDIVDIRTRALDWDRKQPTFATRVKSIPVQSPEEKAQAERDLAEWLAEQSTR